MTALTRSANRMTEGKHEQTNIVPVAADAIIFRSAIVMRESGASAAVPGADTAGAVFLGIALEALDNTGGLDGTVTGTAYERAVSVSRIGEYAFAVDGATPKVGQVALIVDDNTVSADATSNNVACGKFTGPAPDARWWVDIAR